MDPISSIGLLLKVVDTLLRFLRKHPPSVWRCGSDPCGSDQRRQRLQGLLKSFRHDLRSANSHEQSPEVLDYTLHELQELQDLFLSLEKPCPRCPSFINCVWNCVCAPYGSEDLEEAERKLQNLRVVVLVENGMLVLKSRLSTISHERVELPSSSDAGLDRTKVLLEFLKSSQGKKLHVVGIHGQAGLGKTTLLNKTWDEVSSKPPFAARAYVQLGHEVGPETVCKLQSSILEHLGGGKHNFPSGAHGRGKLREHLEELSGKRAPIFLALDNVWNEQDLRELLRSENSPLPLPSSSCIAVTSRDKAMVEVLADLCRLPESNESQVLFYAPPLLSHEEAKSLFCDYASVKIADVEHGKLLEELVALCKGLPFALKVVGGIFSGDESIKDTEKRRALIEDLKAGKRPSLVNEALRLSFDQLPESHKSAFLDVVHFFYGWPWERVERLVGVHVLEDLKNKSLVSKVEDFTKCNQNALRPGWDVDTEYPYYFTDLISEEVVTTHDLTLKFGENCLHPHLVVREQGFLSLGEKYDTFLSENANKLRHLAIRDRAVSSQIIEVLERAVNLQTLTLASPHIRNFCPSLYQQYGAEYFSNFPSASFPTRQLRYLRLTGLDFSTLVLERMLSTKTKEICLLECDNLVQLPTQPVLGLLERLQISRCCNFKSLPACLVQKWHHLRELVVTDCSSFTEIASELGLLPSLRLVAVKRCPRLVRFPSFGYTDGLCQILLSHCPGLLELPDETGKLTSLRTLIIRSCLNLKRLPESICSSSSLQRLELNGCESLVELPKNFGSMPSLQLLDASDCKKLERLPKSVCSLSSLQTLRLDGCESLVELPKDIGSMPSLQELDAWHCKKLERLPESVCSSSSLQTLRLGGCESLVELLSKENGSMPSLQELDARHCKKLERLPKSICSSSSLQRLLLGGCESLVELLSKENGSMPSLQELDASDCKKLERLPESVCSSSSLPRLHLRGCESLVELPKEIGSMPSLEVLHAIDCKKLERLPESSAAHRPFKDCCSVVVRAWWSFPRRLEACLLCESWMHAIARSWRGCQSPSAARRPFKHCGFVVVRAWWSFPRGL